MVLNISTALKAMCIPGCGRAIATGNVTYHRGGGGSYLDHMYLMDGLYGLEEWGLREGKRGRN